MLVEFGLAIHMVFLFPFFALGRYRARATDLTMGNDNICFAWLWLDFGWIGAEFWATEFDVCPGW